MAVDRLTPERRRQLTREALIAAAAEVFTAKGFHAASLDEIADTAGFTKGAIYSNFASKDELLEAVISHVRDTMLVGVADAMNADSAGDAQHDALAAADAWSRLLGRSPDLLPLMLELRLHAMRNPDVCERLAQHEQEVGQKLAAFIEEQFAHRQVNLQVSALDLADLGRAAADGLEQLAAIDHTRAHHYQRLTELLFVLLARLAAEPANNPKSSNKTRPRKRTR